MRQIQFLRIRMSRWLKIFNTISLFGCVGFFFFFMIEGQKLGLSVAVSSGSHGWMDNLSFFMSSHLCHTLNREGTLDNVPTFSLGIFSTLESDFHFLASVYSSNYFRIIIIQPVTELNLYCVCSFYFD